MPQESSAAWVAWQALARTGSVSCGRDGPTGYVARWASRGAMAVGRGSDPESAVLALARVLGLE